MKPRRILIFSMAYYPHFMGGAEVAVKEITDRVSHQEIEFDMITVNKLTEPFEKIGNVNVYRVGIPWFSQNIDGLGIYILSKFLYPFLAFWKALSLHQDRKYDATWSIMASYAGFAGMLFKKEHPNVPAVLTIQEGENFERRHGIFRPLFKMIFRHADSIQVISKFLVDWSRSMGARAPIKIVPNGVNFESFSKTISPAHREKIRSNYGFRQTDTVLVTASRLVNKNAIDDIITALTYLDKSYKFLVLGFGEDEQALKNQVERLKLTDRVHFEGFVDHSSLPEYLQSSDIFIRPSRTEGLGNSFLEAMAAGIPVIATPVGGIPDFLVDGQTGLFCEVNNPKSIAQKAEKLNKDAESREYIVKNAQSMVRNKYHWDQVTLSMASIFQSTIKKVAIAADTRKVLIATGIFPPEIGGPATYAKLLADKLPSKGIDVSVLPFREVRKYPRVIRHFAYLFKVIRQARMADLIFTQDPVSTGLPVVAAGFLSGKKVVMRVAGDYAWEQARQRYGVKDSVEEFQNKKYGRMIEFLRFVQKFSVRRASAVVTPSKYFSKIVSGWMKDGKEAITIHNGIDLKFDFKKEEKYPEKTIVTAGRLIAGKGFDTLISILPEMPGWRLIIIGAGPDQSLLKELAYEKGVKDRVSFPGRLEKKDLFACVYRSHVFALLTDFETFSFQVIEAMHVGTPVITTNRGALPEIISSGHDGILIEPTDEEGFIKAAEKIASDHAYAQKLVHNAKLKAQEFSIDKTIDRLYPIFDKLIKQR